MYLVKEKGTLLIEHNAYLQLVTNLDVLVGVFALNSFMDVHTLSKPLFEKYQCKSVDVFTIEESYRSLRCWMTICVVC
jgi:hypothetical protein